MVNGCKVVPIRARKSDCSHSLELLRWQSGLSSNGTFSRSWLCNFRAKPEVQETVPTKTRYQVAWSEGDVVTQKFWSNRLFVAALTLAMWSLPFALARICAGTGTALVNRDLQKHHPSWEMLCILLNWRHPVEFLDSLVLWQLWSETIGPLAYLSSPVFPNLAGSSCPRSGTESFPTCCFTSF